MPAKSDFFRDANINISQYLNAEGKLDEAVAMVKKATGEKPNEPDFYLILAAIYEQYHKEGEMINALKRGFDTLPENEKIAFALGVALDKAGKQDEALDVMKRVVEINSKNAAALNYVGYTYVEKGEHLEEAEGMLQDAAALKPNDGFILDSLGWLYFKQGKFQEAVKQLEKADSLMDDPVIKEHLIKAKEKIDAAH